MGLTNLLIIAALILIYRVTFGSRGRGWVLFTASILAVFWLQPPVPIRHLDFWLPLATLAVSGWGWALAQPAGERGGRENWTAALLLFAVALLVGLTRYISVEGILTPSRPPQAISVLAGLLACALIGLVVARFTRPRPAVLLAGLVMLVLVFLILKLPALSLAASQVLRGLAGQSLERASAFDIRWLGFSYVAFRLIATLRDRQSGRLPSMSLREYVTYIIFFPAFTAGPIDRPERFIKDLRAGKPFNGAEALAGGQRVVLGVFKKFALADGLAFFALDPANAASIQAAGWMWVAVIAYALRIYFDFSGYTDIAIGLARWLGVTLPENFNNPYLKPNLTQFWNNWHITLTQWFRAYTFNPLTRALRGGKRPLSPVWVILITQLTTMVLIGLWHGGTLNFIFWGLWHGLGLFVNNRYTEFFRPKMAAFDQRPALKQAYTVAATALTFVFVSLGWVWFVLPVPQQAILVLGRLFGL